MRAVDRALTDATNQVYSETAKALTGSARRLLMARVVKRVGSGGQRRAARELGWDGEPIGQGLHALASG
jgi:hypothetical protein